MIKIKFVTPDGIYKETECTAINCSTKDGWRGFQENHMPMVLMLNISRFETVNGNEKIQYAISGGMLYFSKGVATVLVDSIEEKSEIDKERALQAKQRAENRLNSKGGNLDIKRAEIALARALNRINVSSY